MAFQQRPALLPSVVHRCLLSGNNCFDYNEGGDFLYMDSELSLLYGYRVSNGVLQLLDSTGAVVEGQRLRPAGVSVMVVEPNDEIIIPHGVPPAPKFLKPGTRCRKAEFVDNGDVLLWVTNKISYRLHKNNKSSIHTGKHGLLLPTRSMSRNEFTACIEALGWTNCVDVVDFDCNNPLSMTGKGAGGGSGSSGPGSSNPGARSGAGTGAGTGAGAAAGGAGAGADTRAGGVTSASTAGTLGDADVVDSVNALCSTARLSELLTMMWEAESVDARCVQGVRCIRDASSAFETFSAYLDEHGVPAMACLCRVERLLDGYAGSDVIAFEVGTFVCMASLYLDLGEVDVVDVTADIDQVVKERPRSS